MLRTIAPVAALLLSTALLLMGNGLQGPLLAIRAQIESFSTLSIGLIGSFYYIGFASGCLLAPRLVRRAGHIRTFSAMAATASAVPLVHALILAPLPWWVMRLFTGFSLAVLYIVIESWLAERSTNETRGVILSIYQVINLTVLTIGQMMITLADPGTFTLFALSSVLVSIAAVPVALTAAQAPRPIQSARVRLGRLYGISPVGFIGCLGVGLANGAWWSLFPVFALESGLGVGGVAILMSTTVIGGAAGQWPIGLLSDRFDRRKVLLGACLLAAALGVAQFLLGGTRGNVPLLLGAAWGMVLFPLYTISVAHANDHAAPEEFVEVSSGLLLVFAAGATLGPVLGAAVLVQFGGASLFGYIAVVHFMLAAFVLWRMTRRPSAPAQEHVGFQEALVATITVSPVFDADTHPEATLANGDDARRPEESRPSPARG